MAIRTKTIEYPFETRTTSLASATRYDFSQITVYIPETSSRTFKKVWIEVSMIDDYTVAANLTSWLLGIKLGAAAFDDATVSDGISNSGDHIGYAPFTRDVTAYFTTNFGAGASQTCQVGVQFGNIATINITAKLCITYEYDDSSASTRIRTAIIPLETMTGKTGQILSEVGTNQVPNLSTFCPEQTKTFRAIWFEIEYVEAVSLTTDFFLGLALDAESEVTDGLHQQDLITDRWDRFIWVRNDMTTNATHAFKMRCPSGVDVILHPSIRLHVTYEYDHAGTVTANGRVLNSVQVVFGGQSIMEGTVVGDRSRDRVTVDIQEPGTITMAQSGIQLDYFRGAALTGPLVAVGSQTARTYTEFIGSITAGQATLTHRIDSGGAQGAALTLARGVNTIDVDVYQTGSTANAAPWGGILYLNYTSDIASGGDGKHLHTTRWLMAQTAADVFGVTDTAAVAPDIAETSYRLSNFGHLAMLLMPATSRHSLAIKMELLSGEGKGEGWRDIWSSHVDSDGELQTLFCWVDMTEFFDRYPGDFDGNRAAVESAREYRYRTPGLGIWFSCLLFTTYHSITQSVSGTVSGYTGDGSGITVDVHRNTGAKELLAQATTAAGGGYTATCYDDTETKFAQARQDATHVGRSDNGTS